MALWLPKNTFPQIILLGPWGSSRKDKPEAPNVLKAKGLATAQHNVKGFFFNNAAKSPIDLTASLTDAPGGEGG